MNTYPLPITTGALAFAKDNLWHLDKIRIRKQDVSLIRATAAWALDFLDVYGYELIGTELCDNLVDVLNSNEPLRLAYHRMKAGIDAVNAAIEAHNNWCDQESLRRLVEANERRFEEDRARRLEALRTKPVPKGIPPVLTGAVRPAWMT